MVNIKNPASSVRVIRIGIPTLSQYSLLSELITTLSCNLKEYFSYEIHIIDNGGTLQQSKEAENIHSITSTNLKIQVETPSYNLGVAKSFNYLISKLGKCIICNDDVLFNHKDVIAIMQTAEKHHNCVIVEGNDPISGFSTFYVNRPEVIQMIGGFDELFSPAYFEDNDMRYRLKLNGYSIENAILPCWKHRRSSTLKKSTELYKRMHWCNFYRNRNYYLMKWGGLPGNEQYQTPFGKQSNQ